MDGYKCGGYGYERGDDGDENVIKLQNVEPVLCRSKPPSAAGLDDGDEMIASYRMSSQSCVTTSLLL